MNDGQSVLRAALSASSDNADLHYALGLPLTRLKRTEESLTEFQRATELDPDRARYAYVYTVALHSAGHGADAVAVLNRNLLHLAFCWTENSSAPNLSYAAQNIRYFMSARPS
jgi:hypothetical protein